jgi:hypothetical protein
LRDENQSLQQQIAQLQTDNQSLSNKLSSAADSHKLSNEQFNELLKLRGQIGVLQKQLNDSQSELGKTSLAQSGFSEDEKFKLKQTDVSDAAKLIALMMLKYADNNDGLFPKTLEEFSTVTNFLGGSLDPNNLGGGIRMNDFEIYHGITTNTFKRYEQMIILREKNPRLMTDGKRWIRVYAFYDGTVHPSVSMDGNFDVWENDFNKISPR